MNSENRDNHLNSNNNSSDKKNFKNRRHRNYRRYNGDSKEQENSSQNKKNNESNINRPKLMCEICNQPIQDEASAIATPERGNPAHFDCILKKIKEEEKMNDKQQLVYLGSGSFGIIQIESSGSKNNFKIIKKIEFEDKKKNLNGESNL